MLTITHKTDTMMYVSSDIIGSTQLCRFADDYDNGLYRERPWHVTCHGRNFATLEDCLSYLRNCEQHWNDDTSPGDCRPVCHGEMTHQFLANEASLDDCPY